MKKIMFFILIILLIVIGFFFVGRPRVAKNIVWGINFSQKQTNLLSLDWRETYLSLLDDLNVKKIKLLTHWDLLNPKEDEYYFDDLDWQVEEAEKRGAEIILVIGMKTGRWPECHLPFWVEKLDEKERQEKVLELIEKIVLRYKEKPSIWAWQVENEALFPFGECPPPDKDFLEKEINLVKSLDDSGKTIIISDSGEGSFWFNAAQLGDMVGITMYKKVWFGQFKTYVYYPLPPVFYWRKSWLIKNIFDKKVFVAELQAEPWGPALLDQSPADEQEKTMNKERFLANMEFARKTGLDEFYLWGAEWWYWLKTEQNNLEIWNEAKQLFIN